MVVTYSLNFYNNVSHSVIVITCWKNICLVIYKFFLFINYIKMEQHLLAYYLGITIVFGSHIYILYNTIDMNTHSYINIAAAILIAYYFLYKENYIQF